ncbi:GNAT family N-acetyltransferase [Actinomyces sp. MRS3W]|uniref:GNAT family N-acetyltransferase n=1 Tax=Actinomyces sp. MRS3W TaxID=2800796 RepID=UPI0028FD2683|nr:GNAT family N-acetyltransferase [Actinomyces sp. MRS3W]MDU0348206.1 GNAT family N-acetyltransferase [Actinomyces sp. MRS3W]
MTLTLQRAQGTDTEAAWEAYQRIITHLARTIDYPHWHTEGHPTAEEVRAWCETGELYLARDTGDVAGVMVLNHRAVEAYAQVSWSIDARMDEVLVIHALGVTPDHLGQGTARFLVEAAIDEARRRGCRAVRLDTYAENVPARSLYERCGFTDLGCHQVRYEGTDLTDFHLFEYVLHTP